MNLGAEPKKVGILIALVVAAIGGVWYNSSGDTSSAPSPARRAALPADGASSAVPTAKQTARQVGRPVNSEFRPRVLGSRQEDKNVDVHDINPELRLDLLAKVQAVEPINAGRNLFQFGQAPKPIPPVPTNVKPIPITQNNSPPPPVVRPPAGPHPPPPPAPINLKYYGYVVSKADGRKQAFLLDGDDILMVTENQTVKQRYRIVKIALQSIDIEDIQGRNTQTLRLPADTPS